MTDSDSSSPCQTSSVGGIGHGRVVDVGKILYKFARGHKVVFRFAVVKDFLVTDTSSNNVLFVAGQEIATWSFLDLSPLIFGSVNDASTFRGISGVTAEIIDGPNRNNRDVTTEGRYMLFQVQPGAFTMRFTHPNYQTLEKSVRATTADTEFQVTVDLVSGIGR